MAAQPWRTGTVIKIVNETYNTRRIYIRVDELENFKFSPGQFVTLDLPIHEKINKRWRSYSIASWPDDTNVFELLIVHLQGGAGTTYLFNEIKEGGELKFRGPQGVFTLPESIDKDLFFICTGTGIAPFRSMAKFIQLHDIPHKEIFLLFGCRTKSDLLYFDELKQLERDLPGFKYMPTLSREEWEGYHGYVHTLYEAICKENGEKCLDGPLAPASFYLCGWKAMIDEAKEKILRLGYDKKAIHLELYG